MSEQVKTSETESNFETKYSGQTWTTEELQRDFEVKGFGFGWVIVRRKSDGFRGSLDFNHRPRRYFNFVKY